MYHVCHRAVSPAHAGIDRSRPRFSRGRLSLPRPRGDRPSRDQSVWNDWLSPPPTRGSTGVAREGGDDGEVSPAHAGIDPRRTYPRPGPACLPRPRGDRPGTHTVSPGRLESPPPTRGSTEHGADRGADALVSPAHAGIDPRIRSSRAFPVRLPRPRGDRPESATKPAKIVASPPPTRGSTEPHLRRRRRLPVSPAHAGIDRAQHVPAGIASSLPRPRGDRPLEQLRSHLLSGSPPPTRGSTIEQPVEQDRGLVSPAHAGIDRSTRSAQTAARRLPRPRGDRPIGATHPPPPTQSPPPTRGSTVAFSRPCADRDVSPAHAGIDRPMSSRPRRPMRLPRPRGDRPKPDSESAGSSASPPPTRGSTADDRPGRTAPRVSPAHAGIDRWAGSARSSRRCLPRPRGDRPPGDDPGVVRLVSPPPTRGSTAKRQGAPIKSCVSPAHAGIDPGRGGPQSRPPSLPRPRGDRPCARSRLHRR